MIWGTKEKSFREIQTKISADRMSSLAISEPDLTKNTVSGISAPPDSSRNFQKAQTTRKHRNRPARGVSCPKEPGEQP